jgi:two-component system, OmpR family, KDP operon response regulator KdpE
VSAGRILVVDDDPQIRRVMRVTLTAQGYEVSDAKSGEEALERLHGENYDLVLLDMNMSGMGGIKVCRALRCGRHGFELAIIMLTVRNTEKDKVDALDAGADDYVTKPFTIPELLARIRAALRRVRVDPGLELPRIKLENVEIDFSSRHVTGPGRDFDHRSTRTICRRPHRKKGFRAIRRPSTAGFGETARSGARCISLPARQSFERTTLDRQL